jgi:hypothetical protein
MADSQDYTSPGADPTRRSAQPESVMVTRRARMRRRLIHWLPQASFLFVALLIVIGTSLQLRATSSQPASTTAAATSGSVSTASTTVYSVSDVVTGLWQDPAAWVGRTIQVNGTLQGPFVFCGERNPCPPSTLGLVDDGNGVLGSGQYLPVIAPASQHLTFNTPLIYSLQIRDASAACALNSAILCYQGVIQ